MKSIQRTTDVVSVSLPKKIVNILDTLRAKNGQSRSAFIASAIAKQTEEERWREIYKVGRETAKKFKITSEEDIDRILHEA